MTTKKEQAKNWIYKSYQISNNLICISCQKDFSFQLCSGKRSLIVTGGNEKVKII